MMVFPGIKQVCSRESARWQRLFFALMAFQLSLPIAITGLVILLSARLPSMWENLGLTAIAGAFILGVVIQSLYAFAHLDRRWFACRSAAESINSLSWLFAIGAGAFQDNGETSGAAFQSTLAEVEGELRRSGGVVVPEIQAGMEIPNVMREIRALVWTRKREIYLSERIDDQIAWYQANSKRNLHRSRLVFVMVIIVQLAGSTFSIYSVNAGLDGAAVLGLLATLVASLIGWSQAKQYSELVEPYHVASIELTQLRNLLVKSSSEQDFLIRVSEAELAISREHTSWLARRGIFRSSRA